MMKSNERFEKVNMKFVSKRDWWISVVMLGISVAFIGMTLISELMIIIRIIYLLFGLLVLWIYNGTYYVLTKDFLILRSVPLKVKISYTDIDSIKTTKNLISSIALSTDKIKIKVKGKRLGIIYISPLKKEKFINELSKKCPELKILN